jgi:hypothetical protein
MTRTINGWTWTFDGSAWSCSPYDVKRHTPRRRAFHSSQWAGFFNGERIAWGQRTMGQAVDCCRDHARKLARVIILTERETP